MQTPFNYIEEAAQTKSDKFYPEKVSRDFFFDTLATAISALQDLDKIKKAMFYGRDFGALDLPYPETMALFNDNEGTTYNAQSIDMIHAILGIATEAGELLEALELSFGADVDSTNVAEEIGDIFWYQAIAAKVLGVSFEQIQRTNIDKLRARFPDKFTEYDANNRDLFAERDILEMLTTKISETELSQANIQAPAPLEGPKLFATKEDVEKLQTAINALVDHIESPKLLKFHSRPHELPQDSESE